MTTPANHRLLALLLPLLAGCGMDAHEQDELGQAEQLLSVRLRPIADAEVRGDAPASNFGGSQELGADGDPLRHAYLRFSVSGLNGRVTGAKLRCFARNGSVDGPQLFLAHGGWTEGGLTWNNKPGVIGGALGRLGDVPHGSWVELDVSDVVTGDGTYDFAWRPSSTDSMICDSREAQSPPELVVTVVSALRFTPRADALVDARAPLKNFGGAQTLAADLDPHRRSYLRFVVPSLSGEVQSAVLRCFAVNPTSDGPELRAATGTWTELGITWRNQPGFGDRVIGDAAGLSADGWLTYDVTAVVTAAGTYDFVLVPDSADAVVCAAREDAARAPQLVVTLAAPPQQDAGTLSPPDAGTPVVVVDAGSAPDAGTSSTGGAVDAGSASLPGWKLYFADEFNGTTLNTNVWKPYHNTYGDGNNELPCLTPNNVRVGNGTLQITSKRETITCPSGAVRQFSSGFVGTRENGVYFPRYARYEMRAKLPHMNALWPAFWLRHRDGAAVTEIDIMEYFHAQAPGRTTSTLHYSGKYNWQKGGAYFESPTLTPGWHTWAVEIQPVNGQVCIQYFVDGKAVNFNGLTSGKPFCFTDTGPFARYAGQNLFDIAINQAVGGNWVGHPDGPLDRLMNGTYVNPTNVKPTTFPTTYEVDYVRVWTRG